MKRGSRIALLLVVVTAGSVLLWLLWGGLSHQQPADTGLLESSVSKTKQAQTKTKVRPIPRLEEEGIFHDTFKSCVSSFTTNKNKKNKCGEYTNSTVQRIGVLAPPGAVAQRLVQLIQDMAAIHAKRALRTDYVLEVIGSSHVPPYGYGKTHGYTKLVRLQWHSLIAEVASTLLYLRDDGDKTIPTTSKTTSTREEWNQVLRQVVRFHCRLSHVAAHTALLTIDTDTLQTHPDSVVQELVRFLLPHEDGMDSLVQPLLRHSSSSSENHEDLVSFDELFQTLAQQTSHLLEPEPKDDKPSLDQELNQVLHQELVQTNNLAAWPCPSFWTAASNPEAKLTPRTTALAQALSPNCSDPWVTCFVLRDKCEAQGDALCKTPK